MSFTTRDANIKENYLLSIYQAFDHDPRSTSLASNLIKNIGEIYRYLEPGHYAGELLIYQTFDDTLLPDINSQAKYDKTFLINNTAQQLVIQIFENGSIHLISDPIDIISFIKTNKALFYFYQNRQECFYANNQKIEILNRYYSASRYALQYHEIYEALEKYNVEKVRYTSCALLSEAWFQTNRIFFQGGGKDLPEKHIQISLKEYLSIKIRGAQVIREYNLNASKPVDIMVHWPEANRYAMIEIKWLGQSCHPDGRFATSYSPSRVTEGAKQLADYLDFDRTDNPTSITKGYLVVINGRRRGLSTGMTDINCADGLHFSAEDLSSYYQSYVSSHENFEKPFIMFAEPKCR